MSDDVLAIQKERSSCSCGGLRPALFSRDWHAVMISSLMLSILPKISFIAPSSWFDRCSASLSML